MNVRTLAFVMALGSAIWLQGAPPPSGRLVAVADIHGDAAALDAILAAAGLAKGAAWTGGTTRFVQTGDYFDRGASVREVVDRLRALEAAAPPAGGRVDVLLGNHEAMNLIGEYRDVNPAAYAAFADGRSEERRARAWEDYRRLAVRRTRDLGATPDVFRDEDRDAWLKARPPGFVEYVEALAPRGAVGRWLRERPTAVVVDDTVLMHAGLDPDTAPRSVDALNAQVREEIRRVDAARQQLVAGGVILPFFSLRETLAAVQAEADALNAGRLRARDERHVAALNVFLGLSASVLVAPDGPLWFRGFSTWTDAEGAARLPGLLQRYGAARFVSGHSVQSGGRITARFGGRLFLIDTGMLAAVYRGRPSALEIAGGEVRAIYPDGTVVLGQAGARLSGAGQRAGVVR